MLLLRKPWDKQPQTAAPVERSSALGARVRNFYAPLQFPGSADAGLVVTPRGVAFNTAGASRVAVGIGRSDARFTVMSGFIVSDGADPDASGEYIFACRYDGATEPFVFRLNASRQLYAGSFSGGSVTHTTALTLDSYAIGYALVGAATVSDAWTAGHIVNGVDTSTSGTFTGATRRLFTTNIGCADITGALGRYYSKPIHWVIEFDGHLTADERRQVAENPWQFLAPQSIPFPESAGGGGSASSITQADGVATTSTIAATSTAATAITQADGAATASTLAASSIAASAFTQADGAATTSTLAGTAATSAAITQADGAATASTLAASSTAVTALAQADGAATTSTLAGSSTAAAAITQADGVATTSTLAGAAGSASITQADGAATTSTMAGTSTAVSAFALADGVATASALAGASTAVAAITPAAGDATATTMASDSGTIVSATMSPASGEATTSAFAASAVAASVCIAAAGASSAQTVAATAQAVAAISAAAGVATCATLADANAVDTNSAWWTYTAAADNLTFTVAADDLTYTIDVTTLAGAST